MDPEVKVRAADYVNNLVQATDNLRLQAEAKLKNTALEGHQRHRVIDLLLQFRDLWEGDRRGATPTTTHTITLTTTRPLATRPRRFTPEQQRAIETEVQAIEAADVIEDSESPYASDVVLVRKPTGAWRFCIDFRLINQYTVTDKYPLPPISDLIRNIRESSVFVALDLRSGYWQIPMDPISKAITAFRTPRGLKQFKVMPFGLTNAPATFQRMMDELIGDLYWNGVLVYLDDVLIHAKTFDRAFALFEIVLTRFRRADLTLNLTKCDLFPTSIKYLGFIIEKGCLRPNPAKIKALRHVKTPTNVSQVRSILGLAGFYRQFIPNYSQKAEPLNALLRANTRFRWTEIHDKAVKSLLEGLAEQVLANPEVDECLRLETDASDIAIGAILSCSKDRSTWRPIEFMSKTLSDTQRRWPVHEREAWAIVAAINKFDCYLRGREFDVITDNASLKWMSKSTVGKIARWAARLAEYSMTVYHRSGHKMEHVDFLSRYVDNYEYGLQDRMTVWNIEPLDNPDLSTTTTFPTIDEVIEAQRQDPPRWRKGFAMRNGTIFFQSKVYVPPCLRNQIVRAGHIVNPVSHNGMRRTKAVISKMFRWSGMDADIASYVQGCLSCQRIRPGIEQLQGIIRRHLPEGAFEKIYIDTWKIRVSNVNHICLTMIDSLTRWVEVVEIESETTAIITEALFVTWVSRFGVPTYIVSDRGAAFWSDVF